MRLPGLLLAALVFLTASPARAAERWTPSPGARFDIQLESPRPDRALPVDVLELDLDDTSAATVRRLKARGVRLVCYFSAGTYENFRPDAEAYEALRPLGLIGRTLDRFGDEAWIDIRALDRFGPILRERMRRCREKGFDAVDPDNVDAYAQGRAVTGFPLTARDQLAFNRFLARTAHGLGLSVALKNDQDQADELAGDFDLAVNESCFWFGECGRYAPLRARSKAVFILEYRDTPNLAWCRQAAARRDSLTFKRGTEQVDSFVRRCPGR